MALSNTIGLIAQVGKILRHSSLVFLRWNQSMVHIWLGTSSLRISTIEMTQSCSCLLTIPRRTCSHSIAKTENLLELWMKFSARSQTYPIWSNSSEMKQLLCCGRSSLAQTALSNWSIRFPRRKWRSLKYWLIKCNHLSFVSSLNDIRALRTWKH